MTRNSSPGGVPGEAVAAYYARRAAGGAGLIVTEGTCIDHPAANGWANKVRTGEVSSLNALTPEMLQVLT